MPTEIYEIKERSERFLLFKWMKLSAIYLGSWLGLWGILFIILYVPTRKTGYSGINADGNRAWLETNWDLMTTSILWLALAVVVYYIITKSRYRQIKKFEFDDDEKELRIYCYDHFTHIPSKLVFNYKSLGSELTESRNFIYGDHSSLSIISSGNIKAKIGGSSNDWQKLPNTLKRIDGKIRSINTT
jgi:hypothetical protein